MTRRFKVGDTVRVPWGVATEITATILEVWGDPPEHLKVRLNFEDSDEDEDPSVILISPSSVLSAA